MELVVLKLYTWAQSYLKCASINKLVQRVKPLRPHLNLGLICPFLGFTLGPLCTPSWALPFPIHRLADRGNRRSTTTFKSSSIVRYPLLCRLAAAYTLRKTKKFDQENGVFFCRNPATTGVDALIRGARRRIAVGHSRNSIESLLIYSLGLSPLLETIAIPSSSNGKKPVIRKEYRFFRDETVRKLSVPHNRNIPKTLGYVPPRAFYEPR
ncbi:hypothetical protein Scep_019704 [Stephania cephalantha]|uniref:Uncharacterized protein n=1 Tax=Stephania cephalantha TaxID=152367 RepID=A0AAP0IBN6_9MAGN